jgi:hypothetical protein
MQITKACEQYLHAYQDLGNWKNQDKWTNAGLVIEVISYFTLVAPFIVLAAYTAANLAGQITRNFQPSSSYEKIFRTMNDVNIDLSNTLFCLDDNDVNKMRFSLLSHDRVKEIMKRFAGEPIDLLSEEQMNYYLGNLKADEVDEHLYNYLFYNNLLKVNQTRFQRLSLEEAANFMKKFVGKPRNLLSKEQMNHYLDNLQADDVDEDLCKRLFFCDSLEVNQMRFQRLSKKEAAKLMVRFERFLFNL